MLVLLLLCVVGFCVGVDVICVGVVVVLVVCRGVVVVVVGGVGVVLVVGGVVVVLCLVGVVVFVVGLVIVVVVFVFDVYDVFPRFYYYWSCALFVFAVLVWLCVRWPCC